MAHNDSDPHAAHRQALEAIRDQLTAEMNDPDNDARAKAVVARELRITWSAIESLPSGKGVSSVDEVAQKRDERRKRAASEG